MNRAARTLLAVVVALGLLAGPVSAATAGGAVAWPSEDHLATSPTHGTAAWSDAVGIATSNDGFGATIPDDDGNETNDTTTVDGVADGDSADADGTADGTDDGWNDTDDSTNLTDDTDDSTNLADGTDDSTNLTDDATDTDADGSGTADAVDENADRAVNDALDDATDGTESGSTVDADVEASDGSLTSTVGTDVFDSDGVHLSSSAEVGGSTTVDGNVTAVVVDVSDAVRGDVRLRDANRSLVSAVGPNGSPGTAANGGADGHEASAAGDARGTSGGERDGAESGGAPASTDDADPDRAAAASRPILPTEMRVPDGAAPVAGGSAAVGGAVVLGYAARRFAGSTSAASAASAGPAPATASVLYDALRARELPDWIRWLPGVAGYSRYDDTDPLDHEKRAAIFDHLESTPGSYLSNVAEETGIALPTVRYHLKILRHENEVESEVIRGKRRYFPAGFETAALTAALDDEATAAVVRALESTGPTTVSDLADRLDRDPSTVTHHLKRLEEDGIVERERDGRSVLNSLDPAVEQALAPVPDASAGEAPAPADD